MRLNLRSLRRGIVVHFHSLTSAIPRCHTANQNISKRIASHISQRRMDSTLTTAPSCTDAACALAEIERLLLLHPSLRDAVHGITATNTATVTAMPDVATTTPVASEIDVPAISSGPVAGAVAGSKRKRGVFDMSAYRYRHISIHFIYSGAAYHGFASQEIPAHAHNNNKQRHAKAEAEDGHGSGAEPKPGKQARRDSGAHVVKADTVDSVHLDTIEARIFAALKKSCLIEDRESCGYTRCGRTDRGVSAAGQVVSLWVRSKAKRADEGEHDPDNAAGWRRADGLLNSGAPYPAQEEELDYTSTLNGLLPEDIRVLGWCDARPDFSARFSATLRTYRYFFVKRHLNLKAMEEAASKLIGVHDFRNFCKFDITNTQNFVREIVSARIVKCGSAESKQHAFPLRPLPRPTQDCATVEEDDILFVEVVGRAFLWHQIRCVLAILFHIGRGYEAASVVDELLDVTAHPARPQYNLADELPLCLYHCSFGEDEEGAAESTPSSEDADILISAAGERPSKYRSDASMYSRMYHNPRALAKVAFELESQWTKLSIKSALIRSMLDRVHALPVAVDGTKVPFHTLLSSEAADLSNAEYNISGPLPTAADNPTALRRPKAVYVPLFKRPTALSLGERWQRVPEDEKEKIIAQHPVNAVKMVQELTKQ